MHPFIHFPEVKTQINHPTFKVTSQYEFVTLSIKSTKTEFVQENPMTYNTGIQLFYNTEEILNENGAEEWGGSKKITAP